VILIWPFVFRLTTAPPTISIPLKLPNYGSAGL
jgi:hypothetical protein